MFFARLTPANVLKILHFTLDSLVGTMSMLQARRSQSRDSIADGAAILLFFTV
jgi:hypothetical protein